MQRILFVRLGGLGDVVFTLPAVSAVKAAFPEAKFTFLVYTEFAALLEGFPKLDKVIKLNRARFRRFNPKTVVVETIGLMRELRRNRFDLVIDFQGFGETGLMAWWTKAPQRWGSVYRTTRAWAYTHPVQRDPLLHPVEFQLDMVRRSGGISIKPLNSRFMVPESALGEARRLFQEWNLAESRATLFIQPFSNGEHKNWGLADYLVVARHWQERGVQVVFGGGPGEREALEPARRAGFAVAAGAPLLVSAGLAALSTVVLGSDTGLLHLAAAMEKRVVMVISSTRPGDCYPFGHPDWAVVPEGTWLVSAIEQDAVIGACARAFAETTKGTAGDMSKAQIQAQTI